jgi:hypothetical protein
MAVLAACCVLPSNAAAGDWQMTLAPYLWAAGLDGDVARGPVGTTVDVGFDDIFDNLEGGALFHFEAESSQWLVLADLVYLSIGQTTERPAAEVGVDQLIAELAGGYRVNERFELLLGARYTDIEAEVQLTGLLDARLTEDHSWVDPFVGARLRLPLGDKWALMLRGDAGGFGIGAELTVNAAVHFTVRASQKISIGFGYHLMDTDLEEGDGISRFAYDMQTSGPQLGVGFHF